MAFIKKLWKDRISQFPNRRTINDGSVTKQVTVGRDEGTITEPGDSFDASNMNDLEQRIEDAYGDVVSLVASEVAAQYDQENVIFDPVATEGHGTGFVVSSDYIANLKAGDLKDVNITTPTQGEALVWDGTKWVNGTVSTVGNLDDLSDVDTTGKQEGDSLRYIGGEWKAKPTTVEMTQAEYDAIVDFTPYANTHIVITDAPNLNPTASDIEYSSGVTVADELTSLAKIGTITTGTISGSVSCANETNTEIGSIVLDKGIYILVACCDWGSNSSGYRQVGISSNINGARNDISTTMACNGTNKETYVQFIKVLNIESDNTTTKVYGAQNSGGTLSAFPYIYAVRLA